MTPAGNTSGFGGTWEQRPNAARTPAPDGPSLASATASSLQPARASLVSTPGDICMDSPTAHLPKRKRSGSLCVPSPHVHQGNSGESSFVTDGPVRPRCPLLNQLCLRRGQRPLQVGRQSCRAVSRLRYSWLDWGRRELEGINR